MYFWKVDSLVDDFKQNKVTQKEEFKYILLFSILTLLSTNSFVSIDSTYNFYDTLDLILLIIITVAGIYYCFKINSDGDNKDFMVRFISIGLPVVVRVLAIAIPIFIISAMIESLFFITSEEMESDSCESTLSLVVLTSLIMIGYYWYLSKKIKDVSS